MKMFLVKSVGAVLLGAVTGAAFAYDIHTKALVPVAEDKKPAGAEMRFVENGRIGFTIVADMKTEGTVGARCGDSIRPAVDELTKKAGDGSNVQLDYELDPAQTVIRFAWWDDREHRHEAEEVR